MSTLDSELRKQIDLITQKLLNKVSPYPTRPVYYGDYLDEFQALIQQREVEARISENNRFSREVGLYPDDIASFDDELLGKWSERKLTHSKIHARVEELTQPPNKDMTPDSMPTAISAEEVEKFRDYDER